MDFASGLVRDSTAWGDSLAVGCMVGNDDDTAALEERITKDIRLHPSRMLAVIN
jgi:hypothetical protein